MIEINLLPGSVKRQKRKASFNLGAGAGPLSKIKLPPMDKFVAASIAMWVVGLLLIVYMQTSSSARLHDAANADSVLIRDTVRISNLLVQDRALKEKHDTIATKIELIQNLDQGRYQWAHILDEISRALPEATWLTAINPSESDDPAKPAFKIEGRMANAFALPKFMTDLENSPFVENVTLKNSGSVVEEQHAIYTFVIEGQYQEPPPDIIHTVPLFGPDMKVDSATNAEIKAVVKSGTGPAAPAPASRATPPGTRPTAPAPTGRGAAQPPAKAPAQPVAKPGSGRKGE